MEGSSSSGNCRRRRCCAAIASVVRTMTTSIAIMIVMKIATNPNKTKSDMRYVL